MSSSGRKRVSKWDSKEDTQHVSGGHARGSDYPVKSGSYFREKDPESGRFYAEGNGRNGNRRSAVDDDELVKSKQDSRQHSGEAWPRSRVSHDDDDGMMGYYDPRKSSEQDESRQQYFRQSPARDRRRSHRSGSRSNSRSRSRSQSPVHRGRRDGGSYDRQKMRARVSPRSGRELDGRYKRGEEHQFVHQGNQSNDLDWEAKSRKTNYYTEESREQPSRVARSDYSTEFPEENSRRETTRKHSLDDNTSDPIMRSHRNEFVRDRELERRGTDVISVNNTEGEFQRSSSNIPCKFFAAGYCRNGKHCRFSHHGPARLSPERKQQGDNLKQDNGTERMRNRSDTGKSSETEPKGNGIWIDDMEMSPDWNYRVQTLKNPVNQEHGVISQSSQSHALKDTLVPAYEHGSATIVQNPGPDLPYPQQDGNRRNIGMFSYGDKTSGEKAVTSHQNFSNIINLAPVPAFNQKIENHSTMPYPTTLGNQVLPATNLPTGLNLSNPENGNAYQDNHSMEKSVSTQNIVSREQLNHISNISASLAQFFGNGQPIPHLQSTLNPKQAIQGPEVYGTQQSFLSVQPNQTAAASHTQSNLLTSSIHTGGVPVVPDNLLAPSSAGVASQDVAGNTIASEENLEKKTEEGSKERKTGEDAEDGDNLDEEDGGDESKKGKDPKGMRAFKFALVEIVKELLKPAWKEGGMNKDAYKNIVKKVVDKVTGAIQSGNFPQTQDKIDHYLAASKPKLTKLVQAYISKVKKS